MLFSQEDPLALGESLPVLVNRNQTQQLKVAGAQPRPGSPLSPNPIASQPSLTVPQHVQSVQATLKRTSDISTKVTVTFKRNPGDPLFVETRVYAAGYKGNPAPVQMGSGQSPVSFSLENTGEPVTVSVQASGNLGQAPISTAPSTTFQLAKTNLATVPTAAGNGTGVSGAPTFDLTNPGWWSSGDGTTYGFNTALGGAYGTGNANEVKWWMSRLPYSLKITKFSTLVTVAGAASQVGGFAVYDVTGATKLVSFDNFSVSTTGLRTATVSAVTLPAGIYIFASACSQASASPASQPSYQAASTSEGISPWSANGTKRSGTAANAMVAGVLPASLGALSLGGGGFAALPYILMEP